MRTNIIHRRNKREGIISTSLPKATKPSADSSMQVIHASNPILIKPNRREEWEQAAQQIHALGGDELLIPDVFSDDDLKEWTWEDEEK